MGYILHICTPGLCAGDIDVVNCTAKWKTIITIHFWLPYLPPWSLSLMFRYHRDGHPYKTNNCHGFNLPFLRQIYWGDGSLLTPAAPNICEYSGPFPNRLQTNYSMKVVNQSKNLFMSIGKRHISMLILPVLFGALSIMKFPCLGPQ